jgi:hypothetical protein
VRACRSRASSSGAAITCCESSATRRSLRPDPGLVRAPFSVTQMHRGQLHARSCRHDQLVDGPYRPSGRTAYPRGITPPPIMSPARSHTGPSTEIRLSARAHPTTTTDRAHAPPAPAPAISLKHHATQITMGRHRRPAQIRSVRPPSRGVYQDVVGRSANNIPLGRV